MPEELGAEKALSLGSWDFGRLGIVGLRGHSLVAGGRGI